LAACAGATVLLLSGQTLPKDNSSPSVGVFMDFDRDSAPGADSLEVMKKEVEELLKPSGVSLNWRLAKENNGNQAFAGLVVVKFKGKCRVEGWNSPQGTDFGSLGEVTRLGATQVSGGKVLPYSEVECDQIQKALAYLPPGAGQKERQRAMGVALGRVVAHELYHVLASTTGHAARGLAKASQSLEDLIGPMQTGFDARDSRAIGEGFTPTPKK